MAYVTLFGVVPVRIQVEAWLLVAMTGCGALFGCGGRARSIETTAGPTGVDVPRGGSGGEVSSEGGAGGIVDVPPEPVAPEVSRAWSWQPCGTLRPEDADRAGLFDAAGQIVVLGPGGVRVHRAAGTLQVAASGTSANFLVADADGSVLSGSTTPAGVTLTPIGESTPRIVLPAAPVPDCGTHFTFSAEGDYLLSSGAGFGCAWRVSDSTFVGSVEAEQVAIRKARFVVVEQTPESRDVVQRDFQGRELSRRQLGFVPISLSPIGDRAVVDDALLDLDTGHVVAWDVAPMAYHVPLFSPRGEMVLVGDGVYRVTDGVRRFHVDSSSRFAMDGGEWMALAPDGSRAVSSNRGRATLYDVEAPGILAVLGAIPRPDPERRQGTSDLAISADGSLLIHNLLSFSAYGLRLARSFSDSQVVWNIGVELNYSVDISADGRFTAVGGDGRAIHDGRDGRALWASAPPPPDVSINDICLLDRMRLSPRAKWIAGSSYTGKLQVFALNGALSQEPDPWQPLVELAGTCDAPAFSRDERLMATSAAKLYRTGPKPGDWQEVWSNPLPAPPADVNYGPNDAQFSPDQKQLLVSRCRGGCVTNLLSVATGAVIRSLPELDGPHPSFSPEGSWIVASNKLLHLPSGEVRSLDPSPEATSPAIFTPEGDIIAGSPDGTLTRYCRSP